jgi:hypothetical protein
VLLPGNTVETVIWATTPVLNYDSSYKRENNNRKKGRNADNRTTLLGKCATSQHREAMNPDGYDCHSRALCSFSLVPLLLVMSLSTRVL